MFLGRNFLCIFSSHKSREHYSLSPNLWSHESFGSSPCTSLLKRRDVCSGVRPGQWIPHSHPDIILIQCIVLFLLICEDRHCCQEMEKKSLEKMCRFHIILIVIATSVCVYVWPCGSVDCKSMESGLHGGVGRWSLDQCNQVIQSGEQPYINTTMMLRITMIIMMLMLMF